VLALYDSDRELAFVYIFLAYSFEFDESPLKVIGSRIVIPNALWLSVIPVNEQSGGRNDPVGHFAAIPVK
jgi:hypothetical protein